jgi:RNA polymerase sigma factor (sigma-70 family)
VPSKRELNPSPPFLLNSIDRLGRPIDAAVLSIAQEVAPQALSFAEKLLGDPAVSLNLFEEAAAAVSAAVKKRAQSAQSPIRDIRKYLFRTFMRRVSLERKKQVASLSKSEQFDERRGTTRQITSLEMSLLLDEVMAACDRVTQEIALRRLEGFSWEEIGNQYGISAHAARVRFSKALQRLRKALKARGIGG